jgi:hypothetical protein
MRTMDTSWRSDAANRTLAKGGLKFRFSEILTLEGVPLKWEEELPDGSIKAVTNPGKLQELNAAFARIVDELNL